MSYICRFVYCLRTKFRSRPCWLRTIVR